MLTIFTISLGLAQDPISISDVTLAEGDAGTTDFIFTVSVDGGGNAAAQIDFDVNTLDGTATSGTDYDAIVGGTGTIAAGTPSTTITVTVNGDLEVEPDEDFTVVLSNEVNAILTDDTGLGTITNDDSVTVEFSQAAGSDAENSGGNLPVLLVTGTVVNATTVTVTDAGTGDATSGVDYTFTSPQVVNIPAATYDGTLGTALAIPTLSITGDTDVEPNETIDLTLGAATGDATLGAQTATTYTINNDDSVTVEFSQAAGSDAENSGGNLPVLLVTGTVVNATTVTVTDAGTGDATSGVDYTFTSPQVVNIPAATYDGTLGTALAIPTLSITGDTDVEPNETIDLTLGAATGDATLGAQTATTYTINNDDSVTVEFSQAAGSDAENSGGNLPVLLVTGTVVNATTVTVTDAGTGDATSGVDYTFTSPQVVNIPAATYDGTLGTALAIPTLSITGDTDVEPNETIDLTLGAATGDATLGAQTATTYTINNDDSVTVEFSQAAGSDAENSGGNLPVLLVTGTVVNATTVTVTDAGTGDATSGVDYTFTSPQVVNIPAATYDGTLGTALAIPTLSITGDTDVEPNETIDLTLGAATGDATLGAQTATTYTINNDDSVTVEFSQAAGSDAENSGGNLPVLLVTGTVVNATTVTVTDAGTGDATSGVDYTFTSPQVVNIPAATYDGTLGTALAIPTLSITGDTDVEPNETIDLTLGAATGDATLGAQTATTYTINNDDSVTVEFSQAAGSDAENSGGNLPVLLVTGTVVNATTVTVTDAGTGDATSGVDYTFTSPQVVNIPAATYDGTLGTALAIPTLSITGDTDVEPNETIDLTLGAATGDATLGAQTATTYTINNDDSVTVEFSQAAGSDAENSGGNLPVLLVTGTVVNATTVTVTDAGTGDATSGVDYTFTSPQVVNIPAATYDGTLGTALAIPTLSITGDTDVEPNETIDLTLGAATGDATLGAQTATTYTINNDDSVTVEFSQAAGSDAENSGGNLPVLLVTGTVVNATTVTVTDAGTGDATSGVDYTFTSPQVVNIPAATYDGTLGTALAIPTLSITGDTDVEPNETIDLTLGAATGDATLGAQTATTYTINNDDIAIPSGYTVTIDQNPINVADETAVSFTFAGAEIGATYDYSFSSDGGAGTVDGTGTIATATDNISGIDISGLTDGTITLSVTLTNAGGTGAIETDTATKFTSVPSGYSVTINQDPIDENNQTTVGFTFAGATVGTTYDYTFTSNGGGTPVTGNGTVTAANQNITGVDLSGLTNGTITLSVTLTNVNGAGTPAVDTATKDSCFAGTVAPVIVSDPILDFCDAFTQDLDDYTNTPIPPGSVLQWSTNINPLVTGAHLGSSTVNSPNIYYGFFYDTANNCASPVLTVEITQSFTPNPGVTNNFQVCSNAADGNTIVDLDDRITGQDSGTWALTSSQPGSSITINASNIINFDGQPEGDYIFTYTTNNASAPCVDQSVDVTITVEDCSIPCDAGNEAPILDVNEPTEFCDTILADLDDYVTSTAPTGSVLTWSTNPDPLQTAAHRPSLVNAPGSYFGFFYDATNGCASPILTVSLIQNTTPTITDSTGDSGCSGETFTLTATASDAAILNWYDVPTGGTSLGIGGTFITPPITATTSYYVEATLNDCPSARVEVVATVISPLITDASGASRCGEGTVTLSATSNESTATFNWYANATGGTILGTGETFTTPSISATTSFYVEAIANGCISERVEVVATVNEEPFPGTPNDFFACNVMSDDAPSVINLDATLSGQDPGTWEVVTDPSNGNVVIGTDNNVDFTDLPLGDYVFEYTTNGAVAPCNNTSVQVTITVIECVSNEAIDLAITKSIVIESNPTEPIDGPFLVGDIITFRILVSNLEERQVVDIVVSDILESSFEYLRDDPTSGSYDPITGAWSISELMEGEIFTSLLITVRLTSSGNFTNTAELIDSLPADTDITDNNSDSIDFVVNARNCVDPGTICNIFSPNGDGRNDFLELVDHEQFEQNSLEIFDRYGNSVFQMDGYDSTWDGTGSNGELPKGTYFYILDLNKDDDSNEVVKGWIQIIR